VLLNRGTENKYESPYIGPLDIMKVSDNGTVHLNVNAVEDTYYMRRKISYCMAPDPDHVEECNIRTTKKKGNKLVRFEPTNLRIVFLKDFSRKMNYAYLNSRLETIRSNIKYSTH
jgi:hypothetical protein